MNRQALKYYRSSLFNQGEVFKMAEQVSTISSGHKAIELAFDGCFEELGRLYAREIISACEALQDELDEVGE